MGDPPETDYLEWTEELITRSEGGELFMPLTNWEQDFLYAMRSRLRLKNPLSRREQFKIDEIYDDKIASEPAGWDRDD